MKAAHKKVFWVEVNYLVCRGDTAGSNYTFRGDTRGARTASCSLREWWRQRSVRWRGIACARGGVAYARGGVACARGGVVRESAQAGLRYYLMGCNPRTFNGWAWPARKKGAGVRCRQGIDARKSFLNILK